MNEPPSDGWVGRFHQGGVLVQSVRKVAGDTGEVFHTKSSRANMQAVCGALCNERRGALGVRAARARSCEATLTRAALGRREVISPRCEISSSQSP